MSTRVDIDDALADQLRGMAKARGVSLRQFVEEALQTTASSAADRCELKERFEQTTADLGAHLENPWMLLAEIEVEEFSKLLSRK